MKRLLRRSEPANPLVPLCLSIVWVATLTVRADDYPSPPKIVVPAHQGMEISGDVMGHHYVTYVLPSDIANSPAWQAANGDSPPLSVSDAVKLAKQSLPQAVPDSACWSPDTIELRLWPAGNGVKWYYKITLDGPSKSQMTIVVLMDGRAICPALQEEAVPAPATFMSLGIYGNISTQYYNGAVRSSDVMETPAWFASGDQPPVSAETAVKLAGDALAHVYSEVAAWDPSGITLQEWPVSGHWIYKVQFEGPPTRAPNSTLNLKSQMTVAVLMNRQIVIPIEKQKRADTPRRPIPPGGAANPPASAPYSRTGILPNQ